MQVDPTAIPEVLYIRPRVFRDDRGHFLETFRAERYATHGIHGPWTQDNLSASRGGVLRGLHLQAPSTQGKLVHVVQGRVFDVAVDVRRGSSTFGEWVGRELSSENHDQLWVPPGFAHGFVVLSDRALFAYKCSDHPYTPADEVVIRWDDPALAIDWPVGAPELSSRDAEAPTLAELPAERLPAWEG